jgi:hypothetical protein
MCPLCETKRGEGIALCQLCHDKLERERQHLYLNIPVPLRENNAKLYIPVQQKAHRGNNPFNQQRANA